MYELLESNLVQAAFGAILVGYVLKFLVKGYQVRRQRRSLVSSLLSPAFFSFSFFLVEMVCTQSKANKIQFFLLGFLFFIARSTSNIMALGRFENYGRSGNESPSQSPSSR